MTTHVDRTFVPGAGRDWLLPLYDPLVKLFGGDRARMTLVDHAHLQPGHRVLDIGCGTGTLLALLKRLHPDVDVTGIDPDPKALARARRKADRAAASIRLDQGFADALPYADATFDRVFSSFMLHHLEDQEQAATLREVRRVLAPAGSFHVLDFAAPEGGGLHAHHRIRKSSEDFRALMREAGFVEPTTVARGTMLFGHLSYSSQVARA